MGCPSTPVARPSPLRPPLAANTIKKDPKFKVYYVRSGDTFYSIGRQFGVPWQKIQEANRSLEAEDLEVGQAVFVPLHEAIAAPQPDPSPSNGVGTHPIKSVSRGQLHKGKAGSTFWWPTAGRVSRRFGEKVRGFAEPGIGLSAPTGTEVCAASAGTVICKVKKDPDVPRGWGNVVCVRHSDGIVSWYGHLDHILARDGQKVKKGERIGSVGASGAADEPHLALRFYKNERPVDPLKYLP